MASQLQWKLLEAQAIETQAIATDATMRTLCQALLRTTQTLLSASVPAEKLFGIINSFD